MGVPVNSPQGRVSLAEQAVARGEMEMTEYRRIAEENGYKPSSKKTIMNTFGKKNRKPKK